MFMCVLCVVFCVCLFGVRCVRAVFWVWRFFLLVLGLGIGFFGDFTAYSIWYALIMKYNTNSDYKLTFFLNTLYIIHPISYRFRQVKILQEIVGHFPAI